MDWKHTALAAAVSTLFILQGLSCWRRSGESQYRRSLAVLTILLAALGFSSHFLLASGAMVFSPEFGVVMVQGTAAWAALVIVLIGLPVSAAMAMHVSRSLAGFPGRWLWTVWAGAITGGLAVSRVETLDPGLASIAPIRAYDIWGPILPIWLGACLVEAAFSMARVRNRALKGLALSVGGMAFALWTLYRDRIAGLHFADPYSAQMWVATLYIWIPLALATTAWILPQHWLNRMGARKRWKITLAVVVAIVGLVSSYLWPTPTLLVGVTSQAVSVLLAGLILWRRWKAGALQLPDWGKPGRSDDAVAFVALLLIVVGLADALYFRSRGSVSDLVCILVGWAVFVEVISGGPLLSLFSRPLRHSIAIARGQIVTAGRHLSQIVLQASTTIADRISGFFNFEKVGVGILRIILLVVVLVAVAELPHAGKTVVIPFTELGFAASDEEAKQFGRMISNRVVNEFGTLARELETEVAIMLPPTGAQQRTIGLVAADDARSHPEAVVTGDLEIAGVKVPVSLITGWIQSPMRSLLGVRVVTGTVQREGGGYVLLAQTSDGEIFRVPQTRVAVDPTSTQEKRIDPGGNDQQPDGKIASPPTQPSTDRTIAADGMARELAYRLIATLPDMARAGITQSWSAARPYLDGLEAWRRFETGEQDEFDELTAAIGHFREAVRLDPRFALAHHRLGLALTQDRQPFAATDALRRSIQVNPSFALGYHALAFHLYFTRSQYYPQIERPTADGVDPAEADKRQARKLWHQLLQFRSGQIPVVALANAHSGLCRMILDSPVPDPGPEPDQGNGQWAPEFVLHYSAFFHCHRALQLFATLPDAVRDSADVRIAEGTTLSVAGVILSRSGQEFIAAEDLPFSRNGRGSVPSEQVTPVSGNQEPAASAELVPLGWHCSADTIDEVNAEGTITRRSFHRSPYTRDALDYYQRASTLMPDDGFVLCNWANAAFVLGDDSRMQELDASSSAHESLASALINISVQWDGDYARLALAELGKAFQLDPQNLWARNSYSYKVWTWNLQAARDRGPGLPRGLVQAAERHAREAARLAASTGRKSDAAAMRSTLGETLLMQGRPHEAYRELEKAVALAPHHAFFDEIRWELAVAYLCAGAMDRRPGRSTQPEMDFEAKASELLTTIREGNESREGHSLTPLQPLELHQILELCAPVSGSQASPPVEMPYKLGSGNLRIGSYSPCRYLAVGASVMVQDAEEAARLRLRVFGPGIDSALSVGLGATPQYRPLVTLPRADTHDLYFAQLERRIDQERGNWVPVSIAYPIETREHEPCSSNSIVLEFSPPAAGTPSGASGSGKPATETADRKSASVGSPAAVPAGKAAPL